MQTRALQSWFRSRAIICSIVASSLTIIIGSVLIVALSGLNNVPAWWAKADGINPNDAEVISQAERFENAITTQLTAVRDAQDPQWAVGISDEQANAWLAVRLRDTIETHLGAENWPDGLGQVWVRIQGDELYFGVRVNHSAGSNIVTAKASLEIDRCGDLWLSVSQIRVGTTRVPMVLARLLGTQAISRGSFRIGKGALELGDGRVVRVLAIRTKNDRLELVLETIVDDQ